MADFRKLFYALALVAMLAGLGSTASAQTTPFTCATAVTVPPIVRSEGYAELVGDLVLSCTGGIPTVAGAIVPQVNISIFLNTNITSRLTASGVAAAAGWNEALLIVDEPHSASNPLVPILNCGASGAPDNGPSGAGVCSITSTGVPSATYNGALGTTAYGTGHPNVFQARTGSIVNGAQFNAVSWLGVPLDPPGSTTIRTLRFTNIRADAEALGTPSPGVLNFVQANITINGNTSVAINNSQQNVALVQRGLVTAYNTTLAPVLSFLQCTSQNAAALVPGASPGVLTNTPGTAAVKFTEGFASSFKAKNIAHIINQGGNVGNGTFVTGSYWQYNGTYNYPTDLNQNVPGAIYNTETGFTNQGVAGSGTTGSNDPNPNPPLGIGTTPVSNTPNYPFASSTGTGINLAGVATQGTRLAIQVTSVPNGVTLFVPAAVALSNGLHTTGVAVLTTTAADGSGPYTPASTSATPLTTYVGLSGGLAVYEVLFADPFSVETTTIPVAAAFASNLSSNLPQPSITAQAVAGFAPFYNGSAAAAAKLPSATLPVPRFKTLDVPTNLFSIIKCACDLLFPWVVSVGGFDTGIAIVNTSQDPGAAGGFIPGASPQSGAIQFWFYGTNASGNPATQCTNTTTPGQCPSDSGGIVSPGSYLAWAISSNGMTTGTTPKQVLVPEAGFEGYVIAQAQFQYCHAFAFISALGAGPLSTGVSEGYLGLLLDNSQINNGLGLSRTGQQAENLVH